MYILKSIFYSRVGELFNQPLHVTFICNYHVHRSLLGQISLVWKGQSGSESLDWAELQRRKDTNKQFDSHEFRTEVFWMNCFWNRVLGGSLCFHWFFSIKMKLNNNKHDINVDPTLYYFWKYGNTKDWAEYTNALFSELNHTFSFNPLC